MKWVFLRIFFMLTLHLIDDDQPVIWRSLTCWVQVPSTVSEIWRKKNMPSSSHWGTMGQVSYWLSGVKGCLNTFSLVWIQRGIVSFFKSPLPPYAYETFLPYLLFGSQDAIWMIRSLSILLWEGASAPCSTPSLSRMLFCLLTINKKCFNVPLQLSVSSHEKNILRRKLNFDIMFSMYTKIRFCIQNILLVP